MPVLRVSDPDGTLRGVVVNYACHCTTIDPAENTISGDWAGFAQEAIERAHPGAIAMTVIGCGADANPAPRVIPGAAAEHGKAIADELERLLEGPWTPLMSPPVARFRRVRLPFDMLPTRAELEARVQAKGQYAYNAATQLARLDRGEPLQSELDYPVQTWQFGDRLVMVFLAGEVVVDYVLRLKAELDAGRVWVTAYANDVPCYIPSERILREGGYEGGGAMLYYGRPARLKPGIEELIISTVGALVPREFRVAERSDDEMPPPKSPAESLRSIRTRPGLRVELVAAEPLVVDPVAIDFGADGSLWVCEMRDYPTGIDRHWKPGGVIKRLRDTDGDGRYDSASVLLDGVPFPTGVMAWRKGVLICAAPNILYAEDTDGDGKADVRRILFEDFGAENFQGRLNGLTYNLDNWVYGANGLLGGVIKGVISGRVIDIGGRDFRFKPDSGVMEPAAGLTQQGRVHDDWGNQFGNNNSNCLFHFPMPDSAARRNPFAAAPGASVYVPRGADSHQLFPISRTLNRFNEPWSANRTTSACGPCIYRDTALGEGYAGNAFTCEAVHNLVHREILSLAASRSPAAATRTNRPPSCSPRPTTGSGRSRCRPGPTGRCTSWTCTGSSSSIRGGSAPTGSRSWTCAPATTRDESTGWSPRGGRRAACPTWSGSPLRS
jgi:putative membrane-bound dehydrogenase-like protein